jgi:hypothetical protein
MAATVLNSKQAVEMGVFVVPPLSAHVRCWPGAAILADRKRNCLPEIRRFEVAIRDLKH